MKGINKHMKKLDVSIVIPVHNGTKFLKKAVYSVLRQSLRNIEVVLIENGSTDGSWELCKSLEKADNRVRAVYSKVKGTSLARKKGIECAKGQFITFLDQDDFYENNEAVKRMFNTIITDHVQICEFGYYKNYLFGLRRKIKTTNKKEIFTRDDFFAENVKGVAGVRGSKFDTTVWNKIYDANILKSAAENVHTELYFAEDENLNLWAFFDEKTRSVSVHPEAYYVWNVGTGFSSKVTSGEALFYDYATVKPTACNFLENNGCTNDTLFQCHLENLYFLKNLVVQMIQEKNSRKQILNKIVEFDMYPYIMQSKEFFASNLKLNYGKSYNSFRATIPLKII